MKVKLPSGLEVRLGVRHLRKEDGRRGTQAWFKWQGAGGQEYSWDSEAVCSLQDNFCKRTGRKLAAIRLLKNMRGKGPFFSREDRAAVFKAICPEFSS